MKGVILLLIFLLLPAIACAETISLYSGTVEPANKYMTSESKSFTIDILDAQAKVVIHLQEFSMVAANNSCAFNSGYKFCANNIAFSHYNYSLPSRMAYKADIVLTAESGELMLNRTLSPTEIYIGQQVNATIEIRNIGLASADNITYTDNMSQVVDVFPLAVSECQFENGMFTWQGSLPAGMFVRCYALLQGKEAGTSSAIASLYYVARGAQKSASSSISITVKENPLKINYTGNMQVNVGENTTLYFNISTSENLTLGSFWLNVSPNLLVLASRGIQKVSNNAFFLMSDFSSGDSKTFELNLSPLVSGVLPIEIGYKVFFANMIQDYSITPEITAFISQLQPSIPTTNFTEGNAELSVLLNNPTNYSFNNITVLAGSPVNKEASFDSVEAYGHRMAELPFTATEGSSTVPIKITYYSVYKEKFEKTLSVGINVSKIAEKTEINEPQQEANTESQQINSQAGKNSVDMKYVAAAGILVVIAVLFLWAARRRHREMMLGA